MQGYPRLVSAVLFAIVPAALYAADIGAAMLYSSGTTWVNGSAIPKSSAIFPGDLVQTRSDSVAKINGPGLSAIILSDSLIEFQGNALSVERGSVTIATSKTIAAKVGDITVTPASKTWTEFEVEDSGGSVAIAAHKGDLLLADETGTSTLAEGQRTTRDAPSSSKRKKGAGAAPAASGRVLAKVLIGLGAGTIGTVEGWVLAQGDDPMCPK